MPSPSVDLGTGATITFGTSAFTAEITSLTPYAAERESIDTTHLGTSAAPAGEIGAKTYIPADLTEAGSLSITGHFNPDTVPPLEAAAETITITFASGATADFTGFMTSYQPSEVAVNTKMEFTAEIKISGSIDITAAV